MADCILGIKCNGLSMKIDTLEIDSNQERYDYICNVMHNHDTNGNGTYDISIVDKNYIQGMPIGKWRIVKAWITYNWGTSQALFIMADDKGEETKSIVASEQKGVVSGFSEQSLARSIFSKAQTVVSEYPTSNICNMMMDFEEATSAYTWKYIKEELQKNNRNAEGFIDLIDYKATELSKYIKKYKELKEQLTKQKDDRSKLLLNSITTECKKVLQDLES